MILAMSTCSSRSREILKTGTVPGPCKQARIGTRQLDDCLSHVVDMSDDAKLTPVTVTPLVPRDQTYSATPREEVGNTVGGMQLEYSE